MVGLAAPGSADDHPELRKLLIEAYCCWNKCNAAFGKNQRQSLWASVAELLEGQIVCLSVEHKSSI